MTRGYHLKTTTEPRLTRQLQELDHRHSNILERLQSHRFPSILHNHEGRLYDRCSETKAYLYFRKLTLNDKVTNQA